MRRRALGAIGAATLVGLAAAPAWAQPQRPAPDTVRLGALQAAAVRRDPRAAQVDLLAAQSTLRERNLDAERLPALAATALGQYQSDVARVPFTLPGGQTPLGPANDVYDAQLTARQRLYDPTRAARRGVERAQLAESQARVRSTLFALREAVSEAYFTALRLAAQRAELEAGVADLEAQRRMAGERVRGGAALPSDTALLAAELLRRRQAVAEAEAGRAAALEVLGDLTGRAVGPDDALALPELGDEVARARAAFGALRERPEYAQFARSRETLDRQRASIAAAARPRVLAMGRAGYGRPGLNPLGREFDSYWLAGVQVEWTPWTWGATRRDREVLALQRAVVASEEAAFAERVRRGVVRDLADADRLARALGEDDAIVALRERVLAETRLRHAEGVITSAEYVDRETDVLAARLARAAHRVELARARERFLTAVGLEVR